MPTVYFFFLAFLFAMFLAILASFFNLVIYRTAREESFLGGRSRCEHCQQQIRWYDNIPIWSFLALRGRCRHCQQKIAPLYFFSELLAFLFGLAVFFAYLYLPTLANLSASVISLGVLIFLLLFFIFLADWQYLIVPDFLVLLLLFLVIFWRFLQGEAWAPAVGSAVLAFVFLSGLAFLAQKILHKEAMGFGDLKLVFPLALWLSWPRTVVMLFLAFLLGGFFAMLMLLIKRKKIGQALPFAPFLIISTLLCFFYGEAIWHWYFGFLF